MTIFNPTMERKLMVITWLDHFSNNNWHDVEPVDLKPIEVVSVGWLIDEDDVMVALSNALTVDDKTAHTMSILQAAIVDSYEVVF